MPCVSWYDDPCHRGTSVVELGCVGATAYAGARQRCRIAVTVPLQVAEVSTSEGGVVSTKDKLGGRLKKAAGDLLGDRSLRRAGVKDERKAEAKEELALREEELEQQAARVAELERPTDERRPE